MALSEELEELSKQLVRWRDTLKVSDSQTAKDVAAQLTKYLEGDFRYKLQQSYKDAMKQLYSKFS